MCVLSATEISTDMNNNQIKRYVPMYVSIVKDSITEKSIIWIKKTLIFAKKDYNKPFTRVRYQQVKHKLLVKSKQAETTSRQISIDQRAE